MSVGNRLKAENCPAHRNIHRCHEIESTHMHIMRSIITGWPKAPLRSSKWRYWNLQGTSKRRLPCASFIAGFRSSLYMVLVLSGCSRTILVGNSKML